MALELSVTELQSSFLPSAAVLKALALRVLKGTETIALACGRLALTSLFHGICNIRGH